MLSLSQGKIRRPNEDFAWRFVLHHSRHDATLEASRLRLRPILMTSFAFIFGVIPLMTASGAGAEMRRSLGVAVFSGMLGVTVFGVFLTPVFFAVILRLGQTPPWQTPVTIGGPPPRVQLNYRPLGRGGLKTAGEPRWINS